MYRLPSEPLYYLFLFQFVFLFVFLTVDFIVDWKRWQRRKRSIEQFIHDGTCLPPWESMQDEAYGIALEELRCEAEKIAQESFKEKQDALDYFTAWAHQIKTPVAVMKLYLSEETEENRKIKNELFRVEQYVDMVLSYIRLGSEVNDIVIREYSVDEMIRETIRKFAPQFILKKVGVHYETTEMKIVTDKKWFLVILDQLVSNAIKYTNDGEVFFRVYENRLEIADTGMGIASEDLPRIFEKGYTGENGRIGQKSSGLGLYLAKKAASLISLRLSCESQVGKGSCFSISFPEKK